GAARPPAPDPSSSELRWTALRPRQCHNEQRIAGPRSGLGLNKLLGPTRLLVNVRISTFRGLIVGWNLTRPAPSGLVVQSMVVVVLGRVCPALRLSLSR